MSETSEGQYEGLSQYSGTVDVLSAQGDKAGTVELPPEVFDVQVNIPLIHQVVVAQLAAARQGTHDTKTRAEVSGGGAKPYRQKGTGRARQGSIRAPHYSGGGVVHGPTPRSYAQRTPKKMKAAALRGALSDRARSGRVHVVSSVVEGDRPSTRTAVALLAGITDRRNVLVVIDRADQLTARSIRNVKGVHLIQADQLNTYDVLVSDDVIFTQAALDAFLAGPIGVKARAIADADAAFASTFLDAPFAAEPVAQAPAAEAAVSDAPVAYAAVAEAPAADAAVVETPVVVEPAGAEVPAPSGATAVASPSDVSAPTQTDEVPQ